MTAQRTPRPPAPTRLLPLYDHEHQVQRQLKEAHARYLADPRPTDEATHAFEDVIERILIHDEEVYCLGFGTVKERR